MDETATKAPGNGYYDTLPLIDALRAEADRVGASVRFWTNRAEADRRLRSAMLLDAAANALKEYHSECWEDR